MAQCSAEGDYCDLWHSAVRKVITVFMAQCSAVGDYCDLWHRAERKVITVINGTVQCGR